MVLSRYAGDESRRPLRALVNFLFGSAPIFQSILEAEALRVVVAKDQSALRALAFRFAAHL